MKGVASSCVYYLPPAFLSNVFIVLMCFGFLSCLMLYSFFFSVPFSSLSFVTEKGSMVLFDCPISYIFAAGLPADPGRSQGDSCCVGACFILFCYSGRRLVDLPGCTPLVSPQMFHTSVMYLFYP